MPKPVQKALVRAQVEFVEDEDAWKRDFQMVLDFWKEHSQAVWYNSETNEILDVEEPGMGSDWQKFSKEEVAKILFGNLSKEILSEIRR